MRVWIRLRVRNIRGRIDSKHRGIGSKGRDRRYGMPRSRRGQREKIFCLSS